jgi:uncharacterized repeat protein (TIGR03803 family)
MRETRIYGLFALLGLFLATIAHAQPFSVLYNFGTNNGDRQDPDAYSLIAQSRDGNMYSSTTYGGANGLGTVFKISSAGTLTVLYNFDGTHGSYPYGGLALGTDGNLYGTTNQGGSSGDGTVFKITPGGTLTVLFNFACDSNGCGPYSPPVQGTDGNFYGPTTGCLAYIGCPVDPTFYKITLAGKLKTLYHQNTPGANNSPNPIILAADGNFYGTNEGGLGASGGSVFKLTPAGKLTVLHTFNGTDGGYPVASLTQGVDGNFYGTTEDGGLSGLGTVFKLTSTGKLTVLYAFGGSDGSAPHAGLVQATDGNFYGVTSGGGTLGYGTIFKISPTGSLSVLYNFDNTTGAQPQTTAFQHTNGILYADTVAGGSDSDGVFYSLNVGLGPFVSFLPSQSAGKVGVSIGIFGQGFTGTTGVSFGGTPATFAVASDTYLTATVPAGALTGSVTVATPGGNLTSNRTFRVTPQIKSFSPSSGPVGTSVVITGVSLTQASLVKFGSKSATFTVNSDTQVTATVPTGAKTGKITITTPGGTAASPTTFTVT